MPQAGRQSASEGEHYAALALCDDAVDKGRRCPPIWSDCALVVNAAQSGDPWDHERQRHLCGVVAGDRHG